jgi:hypothetical protein
MWSAHSSRITRGGVQSRNHGASEVISRLSHITRPVQISGERGLRRQFTTVAVTHQSSTWLDYKLLGCDGREGPYAEEGGEWVGESMRGTRPGGRVCWRSRWERGFRSNWGYALGGVVESVLRRVGDGWFWLGEMVVWLWKWEKP